LHDFGARGVSSFESAQIGGAAHLIKFVGSDTFAANAWINDYYPAGKAKLWSSSIPAAEHSTVTSHGRAKEAEAYKQIFEAYDTPLVAIVSDSYDIFHAVKEVYGVSCKPMLDAALGKKTLVIRPDSGDPVKVCIKLAHIICDAFGYTTNSKGYKVFPDNIRLIQGDGVNYQSISDILCAFVFEGISTDMIAFGMGGELLQKVNRDTLKFAMKCSAININGDWAEVYKQPVGDTSKHSKRGILKLIKVDGQYKTINTLEDPDNTDINQMIPMYWDKPLYRNFLSFDEVRLNSGFNAPF
jgi:nicotinamide phosphoribosyltransferase